MPYYFPMPVIIHFTCSIPFMDIIPCQHYRFSISQLHLQRTLTILFRFLNKEERFPRIKRALSAYGVTYATDGDMGKSANERTCDEQHVETKHERSNCNCTLSIDVMLIGSKHEVILYFSLRATLYFARQCSISPNGYSILDHKQDLILRSPTLPA